VLDDEFLNSNTMPTCPAAPPPGGLLHVTVSCAPVQTAIEAALVPLVPLVGEVGADDADDEADDDEALADEALVELPDLVALPLPDVLDVQAVSARAVPRAAARPIHRRILAEFTR
jgi:hypothetical protein